MVDPISPTPPKSEGQLGFIADINATYTFIAWLKEVKPRTKISEDWTATNDVLGNNEVGLELDTLKWKRGNGVTAWNTLTYSGNGLEDVVVDLSSYLRITDAALTYAQVGHTHTGQYGAGNLCPNGEFTESGTDWNLATKVGTPTITYETSPIDSGLAAKMVFAASSNEQVFLSTVLTVPGEDVNGLQGTFTAHSTKPCTYTVELLTTNVLGTDPSYTAQAETLTIQPVVAATTIANQDTPVAWAAVMPDDAVKARIGIRIKAGTGQTTPITAYLDNVSYTWAAGSASTLTPQAQGVVATKAANQTGIVTATPTKLLLDSSDIDRGGYLDTTNNQIEIPSLCTGLHTLHAEIPFATNSTGSRRIVLKKNTVEVKTGTGRANADYPSIPTLNYTADMANGDVLELFVEQTSGGNLDVLATGLAVSIVRHDRQPQADTSGPPPAPVAGFTRTPASGTAPVTVTCTSTATGDISSTTYNYGDGSGELISRTHVYTSAYSGNITQTVTGPGGSDTHTVGVTITAPVTGDVPLVKSRRQTAKADAATSVTVNQPTTAPAVGDLMILYAFQRNTASVLTGPGGSWTALGSLYVGTSGVCRAWWKQAVGSDVDPVITSTTDAAMVAGIIVITDESWKITDPWSADWSAEGVLAPAANYTQPAITTQDNNALRICVAAEPYSTDVPVLTRPEGFVSAGSQTNAVKTSNGNNIAVMPAVETVPTAGNAGTAIWTTAGNTPDAWLSMQLAVTAKNAVPPQPTGPEMFPGDPGVGKTITTWIQHQGSYTEWKDQLALVRAVSYPGGVADSTRGPVMFKRYDAHHDGNLASSVATVQDGRILFITYNNVKADSTAILAGNWDNRLDDDIATLNAWRDNYNAVVWTNLLHEPENNGWVTKADRQLARESQRYYVDYMRSGGVHGAANAPTNWAFVGPILIAQTCGDAVADFNNGAVRNDPWWEYDPNWKGPEHGPSGYTGYTGWTSTATEVIYKPVDFYQGSNKYADMAGADLYCFHWQHGVGEANPSGFNGPGATPLFDDWEQAYWTSNPNPANFVIDSGHMLSLEGHTPFERDHYMPNWDNGAGGAGQQHGGERYRMALDRIYGTSDDTRQPIFIAEGAYPIHQTAFTAASDPVWNVSLAYYQVLLQQFADNRVAGFCFWKSDVPADVRQASIDSGTISTVLGTKGAQKSPVNGGDVPGYPTYLYQARYDPTDTRRKLFAYWLDSALQKKKLRR